MTLMLQHAHMLPVSTCLMLEVSDVKFGYWLCLGIVNVGYATTYFVQHF